MDSKSFEGNIVNQSAKEIATPNRIQLEPNKSEKNIFWNSLTQGTYRRTTPKEMTKKRMRKLKAKGLL